MKIIISGITSKDGEKIAYVRFEENNSYAECTIPDCVIRDSRGFNTDECNQIVAYLKENLLELKKQAARVNPIKAMISDENK